MLAPEILTYIDTYSGGDDKILEEVERSTHLYTLAPQMLSGRVQGHFLTMLTSLIDARNVLEIGTFTGFGSICLARGLNTPDSKVVTIDANPEYGHLVKKHLELSGMQHQVEYVTGNALEVLPRRDEVWDLVYIDANKQEYPDYFDLVIDRVRPGGLILSDNVLWSGKVVYEPEDIDAQIIHAYNRKLANDPRVDVIILSIRDGLSMARVKAIN